MSNVSASQPIVPATLIAAVLVRRDRAFMVPGTIISGGGYAFQQSLVNTAGVVTLVNDSPLPGANKVYGTDALGNRQWRTELSGSVDVVGETPTGSIDGTNATYYTANNFRNNSLAVYLNGLRMRKTDDFNVFGADHFTMVMPPEPGDTLSVDYVIL